jgi:hypothetical protein
VRLVKGAGDYEEMLQSPISWAQELWFIDMPRKPVVKKNALVYVATWRYKKQRLMVPKVEIWCMSSNNSGGTWYDNKYIYNK